MGQGAAQLLGSGGMNRFKGRFAIVTGGASGIGAAITERLVAEGGEVLVADINADAVQRLPDLFGAAVHGFHTDVTSETDMERLFEHARERFGTLDAVFNVAGGSRPGLITECDFAAWDFNFRLNLHSAFLGTKLAAKQFIIDEKPGSIVNVASVNGHFPAHFHVAYSAAKAGVIMLTKGAALELGEKGIRVNSVSPGLVSTPLTGGLMDTPGVMEAFLERIPTNRPAEPSEIAGAALYLASSEAAYINGTDLIVDGAWTTTVYPDLRAQLSKA